MREYINWSAMSPIVFLARRSESFMGLDMFLESSKNDEIKLIHYWRKAYVIMDWFEDQLGGVGNLEIHKIDKDVLVKLKEFCEKVITDGNFNELDGITKIWVNPNGLEQWSEYHMNTIKSTKKVLDELELDDYDYFLFHSWW